MTTRMTTPPKVAQKIAEKALIRAGALETLNRQGAAITELRDLTATHRELMDVAQDCRTAIDAAISRLSADQPQTFTERCRWFVTGRAR